MKKFTWLILTSCFLQPAFAQEECCPVKRESGICWGNDPGKTKENYTLYRDYVKEGDFKSAQEPHAWILENVPCLNEGLYIDGVDIYADLAQAAKKANDVQTEVASRKKVLELFDQRIRYFGKENYVLNMKGAYAFNYFINDQKSWTMLYDLYQKIYTLNGKETFQFNVEFYWNMIYVRKKYEKFGNDDAILELHDQLVAHCDEKIKAKDEEQKAWESLKANIIAQVLEIVPIDEKYIERRIMPLVENDPSKARQAYDFYKTNKMYEAPNLFKTAQIVFKNEQKLEDAEYILFLYRKAKNADKELEWREKIMAHQAAPDSLKAFHAMELAKTFRIDKKFAEARTYAQKAMQFDQSKSSEVYSFIGDLYMSSSNCSDGDPVARAKPYFAAYDMYQKAGNTSGMSKASQQFPKYSEIVTLADFGYSDGGQINVGCWIGGTATIRKRP